MVKNDTWIIETSASSGMIDPFERSLVGDGRISFGVSSYGYDIRISRNFKIPIFESDTIIDPKSGDSIRYEDIETTCLALHPGTFVLARSYEYFRIPRDVLAVCYGKSTYARCGVIVNVTPLEPEWEGYLTISIANTSPVPVRLYADEGIGQLVFFAAETVCATSYADRKGKYQAQTDITTAKV